MSLIPGKLYKFKLGGKFNVCADPPGVVSPRWKTADLSRPVMFLGYCKLGYIGQSYPAGNFLIDDFVFVWHSTGVSGIEEEFEEFNLRD